MGRRLLVFFLTFTTFIITFSPLSGYVSSDLSEVIKSVGVDPDMSTIIITRLSDGAEWTSNKSRLEASYPPASTTKIPHTLIAIEEGYAEGPEAFFKWDKQERAMAVWNQDQTLSSAYKHSAIWVYQRITHDLGYEVMSSWMDKLKYGNRYIGEPEDIINYWIKGPLLISARQQIEFLSYLVQETLPFSSRTYRLGKEIMQEHSTDYWVLYSKTGFSGTIGWYVGWVETYESEFPQTYVFAFNMNIIHWDDLPKRKEAVKAALCQLGVIRSSK